MGSREGSKLTVLTKFCMTLVFMHLFDISNDFLSMFNFKDMIYIIISLNPTVDFVIRLSGKELSDVSYYVEDTLVYWK
jgi:hypothetical protein